MARRERWQGGSVVSRFWTLFDGKKMIRKAGQTRNGEERVDIVSITHRIEKDIYHRGRKREDVKRESGGGG